jgi:hypothetical protein
MVKPLPDILGCPKCGRSVRINQKRCPGCGLAIKVIRLSVDRDGRKVIVRRVVAIDPSFEIPEEPIEVSNPEAVDEEE